MKKNCKKACAYTSIGGQALIEGIMMRGPEKSAMAVRDPEGKIVLEVGETPKLIGGKLAKLPFARGIFAFISSMASGYKYLMRSADIALPEEAAADREKSEKRGKALNGFIMGASLVLSLVLCFALFLYLPTFLFSLLSRALPELDSRLWRSVFEGVLRILIFIGYLCFTLLFEDIRRTFSYHGAEHKTIFCYERGLPLTVENVRAQSRFHPRCGTSFMILMLLVGIIIGLFIPLTQPLLRTLVKLALLPITMGIGYELIKFAGKHDNVITRIVSAPGVALQHLTTREPDDGMIECAILAFREVLPEDDPARTEEKDNCETK
ncbi:MAG: DUF1385 domain-containing protein [Clostridia bacterium]|nr:DUF1385 domain-containing protein [Clostridia bacterium]